MVEDRAILNRQSKLVKLIFVQKWKRVRQYLITKAGITEARASSCSRGITILSLAVNYDAPVDIVHEILKIEPLHSLEVDSYGMLPLHVACINGASPEIIKLLLDHDQGACTEAIDTMRRAPLHYAVQYICQPTELLSSFRDGSTIKSFASSLSNSVDLYKPKRPIVKRGNTNSVSSNLTMNEDSFQTQIRVIEILTNAAPEIIFFADRNNQTPIDILQDCIADYKEGSKWERASIICSMLREASITIYREMKIISEMQGYQHQTQTSRTPESVISSNTSTSQGSNISGVSHLSRMEIDCTSYNQMNVSISGEDMDSSSKQWNMREAGRRGTMDVVMENNTQQTKKAFRFG